MQFKTIREAAERYVSEMNAYPQDMISTLMEVKPEDWREVTMAGIGDRVYVANLPDGCECYESYGEIANFIEESDVYLINLDDGNAVEVGINDFEVERDDYLPMWGWMWSFSSSAEDYWLEEQDGIRLMSNCGFRIYENDEWGYFFGIDGAGYDFYEAHWIPLYRARGMQWHDERTEHTADDIRKMLADAGVSSEIIESIMTIPIGSNIKIGGYHGGYLSKDDRTSIEKCGHFIVEDRHEKVQEMNGLIDNDYCIVKREI